MKENEYRMTRTQEPVNTMKISILALCLAFMAVTFTGCSGMLDVPGDAPGLNVSSSTGGYSVAEHDGTLDLNVTLNSRPSADVTIPVSINDTTEAETREAQLVFTPANWSTAQVLHIDGNDEWITDGNQNVSLVFGTFVSDDPGYAGLVKPSMGITVIDDETDSIVVSPVTGLTTTEAAGAGHTATFTVVLSSNPTANVVITLTSSDTTEGTVSPGTLTFTPDDSARVPQTVTITGADDIIYDRDVNYTIQLANAVSADAHYSGMAVSSVAVTTIDDELPAVVVTPTTLTLAEDGASGTFAVRLLNVPTGDVTIPLTLSDPATTRMGIDKTSLTFTPGNYNVDQVVTVDPAANAYDDGPVTVVVQLGAAAGYNDFDPDDVTVNITDNDTVGMTVSSLSRPTTEDGQDATFTVRLSSRPTDDVVIAVNEKYDAANNLNQEGTVDTTSLTFTPLNWSSNQTVRVTGINDDILDGNIQYRIQLHVTSSNDAAYLGLAQRLVTVINNDNDFIGFQVVANGVTTNTGASAVTFTGFATDDAGNLGYDYANFTIRPGSEPTANITLTLALNATGTTYQDGTLNTTTLLFTPLNWKVTQTVQVTGHSDGTNEGGHDYAVTVSIATADTYYSNPSYVKAPSFTIFSSDNDVNNEIAYCRKSGGFGTSEGGGKAYFWLITKDPVALSDDEPVALESTDTSEGTVTANVTITSANWDRLEDADSNRAAVTGVDDADVDGSVLYTIDIHQSTGPLAYEAPDVALRNSDNEQVIIVGNAVGSTTENGGTATFGVKLGIQPTDNVSFTIAIKTGSTEGESLDVSDLTFTNANWSDWQTITITGKDDHQVDGNAASYVSFGPISTADLRIDGYQHPDVAPVVNIDNDKLIYVTNATYYGNLNGGIAEADGNCNLLAETNKPTDLPGATFLSLMVDGTTRIATTDGSTDAGQTNWVLLPNTEYYLKSGSKPYTQNIFTTNEYGLPSGALLVPFTTNAGDTFWTGLNADWTTSTDTCGGWTLDLTQGRYGSGNKTDANAISAGSASNGVVKKIIAVQQ
ncbi:MAG: DUF1554 domain-containing protein [Spirochaetes bacterium]|nr:MAG: DUF1554 domain-containing protein [Spirochaetota bacterium]